MDIKSQLMRDEDLVLHAYPDSKGYLTIGFGRLIDKRKGGGLTYDECLYLLHNDIVKHKSAVLKELPWSEFIGEVRLGALINMHFQLGNNLWGFKKTIGYMAISEWTEASIEMLDSKWAREDSPLRAKRVSEQVRTNLWV